MCGGASQVLVGSLNLPQDIEVRLKNYGLSTAQDLIDEGKAGLLKIGIREDEVNIITEIVHRETDHRID